MKIYRSQFSESMHSPALWRYFFFAAPLIIIIIVTSCSTKPAPLLPSQTPPATRLAPTPTSKPTPHPQSLIICGIEPQAVSPFWPTQAGDDILALFYEPPVERVGYIWEPRLVERIPSLQNGDAMTVVVPVTQGMRYTDSLGKVQTYQENEPSEFPQLSVKFTLKAGITWSDGVEITAKDAVLGYHLAQTAEVQGYWQVLAERTSRFFALDDRTLQWEGLPGYISTDFPGFLFPLQPAHRWQGSALPQILQDRTPLATGPFQIIAWETGREVRLEPNPYYSGNPPKLDSLIVRFPQQPPQQWGGLITSGDCDIILPEPAQMIAWRDWAELQDYGYVDIVSTNAPVILRLDFNVSPADPSPVSQKAVRQGLAACIDRDNLISTLPEEATIVAEGFLPPSHPAYGAGDAATALTYSDPEKGKTRLTDAGWIDKDGDGTREAYDVPGFTDGHPLSLTLHMAPQYFTLAAHLASNMEACGADIEILPTDTNLLYTSFEASPLYGRNFEMALFGWQVDIPQICGAWRSDRIPGADNNWSGENFSGYVSELYDTACAAALSAVDSDLQFAKLLQSQSLINLDVPTLFLAWRPFWFISRPYVQGLLPDVSAPGAIWNAESLSIQE